MEKAAQADQDSGRIVEFDNALAAITALDQVEAEADAED